MVDVEKELDSIFEEIDKKNKVKADEYAKTLKNIEDEHSEFDQISNSLIVPVMQDYHSYLDKKDIRSSIEREPMSDRPKFEIPSVSFRIKDIDLTRGDRDNIYPTIKFYYEDGKIKINSDAASNVEQYDKDQINQEMVSNKLANLVKSCYDKN